MSPVYFLTVLVAVVGSACFADEGREVAMGDYHPSVTCPGSSCKEVCKCNSEYGETSCSKRGDNYTIFLGLGFCMNLLNGSIVYGECPYASGKWRIRIDKSLFYSFQYNELIPCAMTSIVTTFFVPTARKVMEWLSTPVLGTVHPVG